MLSKDLVVIVWLMKLQKIAFFPALLVTMTDLNQYEFSPKKNFNLSAFIFLLHQHLHSKLTSASDLSLSK